MLSLYMNDLVLCDELHHLFCFLDFFFELSFVLKDCTLYPRTIRVEAPLLVFVSSELPTEAPPKKVPPQLNPAQ